MVKFVRTDGRWNHHMRLGHDQGWNIPTSHPFYAPLPCHYRDIRFHFVFFHADPSGVRLLLPEPLEPDPHGLCVAAGLDMPYSSSYGAFLEAFTVLKCTFRDQSGWYCSHVFHTQPAAICAGRDMTTTATMAGQPVITVSTNMESTCQPDDTPSMTPNWRLKIIPRAEGPGPAVKQLIDCTDVIQDAVLHATSKGTGTVRFHPNPVCDLSLLKPNDFVGAYYQKTSYSEGYAKITYDYLADQ